MQSVGHSTSSQGPSGSPFFGGVVCGAVCGKILTTFSSAEMGRSLVWRVWLGWVAGVLKCFDFAKKMELRSVKVDESASTKCCVDKALGVDILGSRPSGLG